ncbi:MAG TPA: cupin domain-containing protein [Candidatus Baltobacteraceae bacterium]|jgi:mannose-6-phosphate isomerase-like protein (cupin superfamily)|nr:cupin domain-containing protein [Candidatus Baltobacteraceae bacterium]
MTIQKINLAEKLRTFSETWSPKIVGELNDFHVKVVKLDGEFVWHHHEVEDELFLVLAGEIAMHYRDGANERCEVFGPGEFLIVPHGVEHKPAAIPGTELLLLEPKTTVNTGTAGGERTAEPVWI